MSESNKVRLLVLTSTFPRWADDYETPPFVFELSRRLAARFEVTLLAPHAPGAATSEVIEGIRVRRYRYAPERWECLAYGGGILPRLRRQPWLALLVPLLVAGQFFAVLRLRRGMDLIHAHWVLPQGMVAALAGGCQLLSTAHGGDLFGLRSNVSGWLKRWTLDRTSHLTVVSPALADEAVRIGIEPERVTVAPMGVDLRHAFTPARNTETQVPSLLFVGRLVVKKGLSTLIEALPDILERHPKVRLRIVGEGPERQRLEALAKERGVAGSIDWAGAVANRELPGWFRAATVVVFPSVVAEDGDREGFGLVAVEALGCGRAVVGSDLAAMREFLRDGETGLVFAAGDPSALAMAVVRLLNDPALRERLGQAGRHAVLERYDWDAVAERYAGIIKAMVPKVDLQGGS